MSHKDMKFENIFRISTFAMRLNRCHPSIVRDKIWAAQFTVITAVTATLFGMLLNSIFNHDLPYGKYAEASKNIIMVIVSITITFKYAILVYHQNDVIGMINEINQDYETLGTLPENVQKIVLSYSEKGVQVCKLWLVISIASSVIFPLKAFLIMGYLQWKGEFRLVLMFDFTFPDTIDAYKDVFYVYCILFLAIFTFACYASTMYLGFDPVVPICMLHCCGQLEVVSQRITELYSETTDENVVQEKLKEIITKVQNIYRFVDILKKDFTVLYEFTMKTTTFLVPLSAFQVVECLRNRDTNLEFIPFFIGTFVHFYVPCYYGNLLMEKSEAFRQAIYSCSWECHSGLRTRRTILFMLARASRPVVISTVFCPICLDTFAEMCRTSYALFNLMSAAWM